MSGREDDAWEDLVRRLEATDSGTLTPRAGDDSATGAGSPSDPEDGPVPGEAPRVPGAQGQPDTESRPGPSGSSSGGTGGTGPRAVRGFDFAVDPALLGSDPHRAGAGSGPGPRDWQAAEDPTADAFVPEEPEPLLAGRPDRVVAWIAALGLPLIMLVAVVFFSGRLSPLLLPMLGIGTVAAWGYLFWKLPTHRADEGDDGARL